MWVSKYNKWHSEVSPLEKFLIERMIQRCDYKEIISNKHRTANGYTQLKELIQLCLLSVKRSRSVKTLLILIEESTSPLIKQNIVNDDIIHKYFLDLEKFISRYPKARLLTDRGQVNLTELGRFQHQLKIFEIQLDRYYFDCLKKEFFFIDFSSEEKFQTRADYLSALIDILIPYLIFHGYSTASISEVLISWIVRGYRVNVKRVFDFFHFQKRPFHFYQYLGKPTKEIEAFLQLMQQEVQIPINVVTARELGDRFTRTREIDGNDLFALYSVNVLDPHNHIRNQFDKLLKRVVIRKERQSLAAFVNFFGNSFWSHFPPSRHNPLSEIALDGDSINVGARGKTLFTTLAKCSNNLNFEFNEDSDIPIVDNETLRNSIYYYNLALGSKSIENSLSLLWTALESIIPYRTLNSDIECVQEFISKSLCLGSVSRDVHGFALRFIQFNQQNANLLSDLGTMSFESHYSSKGLSQWFNWISDKAPAKKRFLKIKGCSELLAFQYSSLGMRYSLHKLDFLAKRINSSRDSIRFQLQRIYLHRNQIVHAGDMVSEYSNLWMHLEWYVGKLLAYFVINLHFVKRFETLEAAYRSIEADHDYLMSYLDLNRSHPIASLSPRIKNLLFDQGWRAF